MESPTYSGEVNGHQFVDIGFGIIKKVQKLFADSLVILMGNLRDLFLLGNCFVKNTKLMLLKLVGVIGTKLLILARLGTTLIVPLTIVELVLGQSLQSNVMGIFKARKRLVAQVKK